MNNDKDPLGLKMGDSAARAALSRLEVPGYADRLRGFRNYTERVMPDNANGAWYRGHEHARKAEQQYCCLLNSNAAIQTAKSEASRVQVLCTPRSGSAFTAAALSTPERSYAHEPFVTQYLYGSGAALPIPFYGVSWLFAAYPVDNAVTIKLTRHPIAIISSIYRRAFLVESNTYGHWACAKILKRPELLANCLEVSNAIKFFVAWDRLIDSHIERTSVAPHYTLRVEDIDHPNADELPRNEGDHTEGLALRAILSAVIDTDPVYIAQYCRRYGYDF